jgi:hypothetical protein
MSAPAIPFSDLSKHSKRVAESVDHAQRIQVTRRDGEDLYLTTARHDREREETADVTARLFAALTSTDDGERVILRALPAVFPWVRHLSEREMLEFTRDLIGAIRDVTELDVHTNLHRIIIEWRATARILADPELTAQLARHLPEEDHGTVMMP